MGLTSTALLVLAAILAISVPGAALLTWHRMKGPAPVRAAQRLSLVALAQVSAVLLAFVSVNNQYQFYTSWQDLLGTAPAPGLIAPAGASELPGSTGGDAVYVDNSRVTADGGRLLTMTVRGGVSGITDRVLVHLPAGYDTSMRSYPVVELLAGWHSPPQSWIDNLDIFNAMKTQQRAGTLQDVVTVIPNINVAIPRDVECTDVPHGPQAETWLTTDIHNVMMSTYRVLPAAKSWALMGYSTGGNCATKFALHKPNWYGSVISLSGYFNALKDSTTGDLWGGNQQVRNNNSPIWIVSHRIPPAISLLAFTSRHDNDSYVSTMNFLKLAHAPLKTYSLVEPSGGHNLKALAVAMPEILRWLGAHLVPGPSGN